MQFAYPITILPNTTAAAPKREITKVCYGVLKQVSVYFPWGCAGLVGIRILHYEHQLYPTNPDEWFTGNEIEIKFSCEYLILQGWNDFKIEGYNEDDFYEHTPVVTFNVLPIGTSFLGGPAWVEG